MAKTNELPALREDQDIFARFDELDDRIILAELENRVIDEWVYHFPMEGQEIWGISKSGIDACMKELGKKGIALREEYVDYRVDPTNPQYILFSAKVNKVLVDKNGNEAHVESVIGTKRQNIMLKLKKEGRMVENRFWFEQGSQKALRNAKLRLIPEEIKTKIIEFAKQKKKVRTIEVPKVVEDKKGTEFPDEKHEREQETTGFPDEKVKEKVMMITQEQIFRINSLEATLVDMYKFTPDKIINKLKEKWGVTDHTKVSADIADQIIAYFQWTLEGIKAQRQER